MDLESNSCCDQAILGVSSLLGEDVLAWRHLEDAGKKQKGPYKILYAGPLGKGGTCLDRMQTMMALGVAIVPFNTEIFAASRSRLSQSIATRFHLGSLVTALN